MNRTTRVLIIANGIDRSEAAIFAGLQEAGLRLRVFHDPGIPDSTSAILRKAGIPAEELAINSRIDRAAIRRVKEELAAHPCDLVYAPINRTLSTALIATRKNRIPVAGYRGTTGHIFPWDPASWLTYLNPRLTHVVCVSDAVKEYLRGVGLPPERLTRIYKGHDPDWYAPREPDPPLPEAEAGRVRICFAGRIRPVKGVRYLLDALQLIPEEEPVSLLLVGDVDEPAIRKRLEKGGWNHPVHSLGHRQDATAIIGQSDILVLPSVGREGLPRAAVEAMSQKIPVVASGVGGLPEIVLDGETGLIVPPRDAKALASALCRLCADAGLRQRMGEAGRRRVENELHIRNTIESYAELFGRIS